MEVTVSHLQMGTGKPLLQVCLLQLLGNKPQVQISKSL